MNTIKRFIKTTELKEGNKIFFRPKETKKFLDVSDGFYPIEKIKDCGENLLIEIKVKDHVWERFNCPKNIKIQALKELKGEVCPKCKGSGRYASSIDGGICWKCGGHGII